MLFQCLCMENNCNSSSLCHVIIKKKCNQCFNYNLQQYNIFVCFPFIFEENLKEICVAEQEDAKRKADEARKIEKEKMEKEENRHREERRQKNKETRKNVLEEIMQTEKEFLFSLQIGLTTFLNDADMVRLA